MAGGRPIRSAHLARRGDGVPQRYDKCHRPIGALTKLAAPVEQARDRKGVANFPDVVRAGSDPDPPLTDPALFQSLRGAMTRAQLAGLARYRVAESAEAT
jgi:hypothetical protein